MDGPRVRRCDLLRGEGRPSATLQPGSAHRCDSDHSFGLELHYGLHLPLREGSRAVARRFEHRHCEGRSRVRRDHRSTEHRGALGYLSAARRSGLLPHGVRLEYLRPAFGRCELNLSAPTHPCRGASAGLSVWWVHLDGPRSILSG